MKKAVVEAEAYAPVEDVYALIEDFEGYGDFSEYVNDIRVVDDGENPEWEIEFRWWIVSYTARSKVLEQEENEYIEWRLTKDVD
ncbi:MAG: SRPBCC family protein, partial [Halobacteriota archaeon]